MSERSSKSAKSGVLLQRAEGTSRMIRSALLNAACCTRSMRWQHRQKIDASCVAAYCAEKLGSVPARVFLRYLSMTASDFVAQYTTRQEYRYGEALPDRGNELISFMTMSRRSSFAQSSVMESANASTALAHVEARILSKKSTPLVEVRDILRRAAALLCRSRRDESAVARYLVSIPFALFTKQSTKLGVSLWLGVMNENPRLEPKMLTSIAQQWEFTISRRVGLFSPTLTHPDPFFLREEFAPSELEALAKKRQQVHDVLSPHTRLLQFFTSHFNATRLGSPDIQRVFLRMLDLTMDALKDATAHPMAREVRFHIVLLGLKVLRASTTLGAAAQWRLKEKIL